MQVSTSIDREKLTEIINEVGKYLENFNLSQEQSLIVAANLFGFIAVDSGITIESFKNMTSYFEKLIEDRNSPDE